MVTPVAAAASMAASAPAPTAAAPAASVVASKGQLLPAHLAPQHLEALGRGPGSEKAALKTAAEQLESDVPMLEHLTQVMPAADFFFGGAMLLLVVLVHATGLRWLTNLFEHRLQNAVVRLSTWRPDVLLGGVVMLMLMLHLLEIFVWSAALVWGGLVDNWRAAGFFAANTYTTVGYGSFVLPNGWHMLAPIIAISGLFTFGWTGSVLVDIVRRCQEAKAEAQREGKQAAHAKAPPAR